MLSSNHAVIAPDRNSLMSLELGRPALTKEEDCNVGMPRPIDEQYVEPGTPRPLFSTLEQSTSPLLPLIQVIGGIARLLRILKSDRLAMSALQAYDSHFKQCVKGFPALQESRPSAYIDPNELPPIIYLQNARLMLHRHNLRPTCDLAERSAAIDQCVLVAKDTAAFLRRCMRPFREPRSREAEQTDTWERRMVSASSAFLCTHIWRCTLFLCFRLDFENALSCARVSAVLDHSRPVNMDCGKYLEFFLHVMASKLDRGAELDGDEEMIAYVSGDLQGSFENSWIWQKSKGDVDFKSQDPSLAGPRTSKPDWNGWDHVLETMNRLSRRNAQERQQLAVPDPSLRPSMMLPPLAPSPTSMSPSNRMSIKDLI